MNYEEEAIRIIRQIVDLKFNGQYSVIDSVMKDSTVICDGCGSRLDAFGASDASTLDNWQSDARILLACYDSQEKR